MRFGPSWLRPAIAGASSLLPGLAGLVSVAFSWGCCWIMRTLDELMAGVNDDGTRQVIMALAVPVVGMLSVRGVEAGFGLWVALACYAIALGTLLYRDRLDAFFWKWTKKFPCAMTHLSAIIRW